MDKFLLVILMLCSLISFGLTKYTGLISDRRSLGTEYGPHYQGDMLLTPEQESSLNLNTLNTGVKPTFDAHGNPFRHWKKMTDGPYAGKVVIPFEFSQDFRDSPAYPNAYKFKTTITNSMAVIEYRTCIFFKYRESEEDYIEFINGNGCSSNVGKVGGKQIVNLQFNGCMDNGIIMHELIHALGFMHMQSRNDRDSFIAINWGNIQDGAQNNFYKVGTDMFSDFGTPYDFGSIMHYDAYAFSKNGGKTITKKEIFLASNDNDFGQRYDPSWGDIERINKMYECPA